jgi:DHA1 family inner membrane transport protein
MTLGLLFHGYRAECEEADANCGERRARPARRWALLALALGTFGIGTGEFGSNGILQLFARDLGVSISTATTAIEAYAAGVIIGAPLITCLAAKLNRRTLLLAIMVNFIAGNLISASAGSIELLVIGRFITGMTQGVYFGAGAVVATYVFGSGSGGKAFAIVMGGLTVAAIIGSPLTTFISQHFGWQATYLTVAGVGLLTFAALWRWVPRTRELDGGSIRQELGSLRRPRVWLIMGVAALGISSIFAVYTFIGPYVTEAAGVGQAWVPIALASFGLGTAVGNALGGRLADHYEDRGLVLGLRGAIAVLAIIGSFGTSLWILIPAFFGVGATTFAALPTIQVQLTTAAPEAPTLMGAMNLASLNVANLLGALIGAMTISAGLGVPSTAWAGCALTTAGLLLFAVASLHHSHETVPAT